LLQPEWQPRSLVPLQFQFQQFPEDSLKEMQTVRKGEGIKQNSSAMCGFQSYFPIDINEIFAL
jgi:hypothetical protein